MLTAYTDGACRISNPGLCSCAFVVYDGDKQIAREGFFLGPELHTNNYAEYQGLLRLLDYLAMMHYQHVQIFCDSALVVNQSLGKWTTSNPNLAKFSTKAYVMLIRGGHTLTHIKGHDGNVGNEEADKVCNEILDHYQEKYMTTIEAAAIEECFLSIGRHFWSLSPTEQRKWIELQKEKAA